LTASREEVQIEVSTKNVDIKFITHEVPLELPSSGTLGAKIYENQTIKKPLGARKPMT